MSQNRSVLILCALSAGLIGCGDVELSNGFELSEGDRGKIWVLYPNKKQIVTDVTGVWSRGDMLLVERSSISASLTDSQSCLYIVIDTKTTESPTVGQKQAKDLLRNGSGFKRRALTSGSCLHQQGVG